MSKETDILEGMHYDVLLKWIEKGKVDILPQGMEDYMNHLTAVVGFHNQGLNQTQIIKRLRATFNLTYHIAKSRWVDGLNFFYLDKDVTHESYMKIYADKLDKIIDLTIQTATSSADLKNAITAIKEAVAIREKIKPKEKVSEDLFKKPNKLYTLKLEDLGVHEPVNRNLLGNMIDNMEALEESEKIRIKQEASIEPRVLFDYEQETED